MDRLQTGDPAPTFTLPSDDGDLALTEHAGEWVVVYFYPRDFTSGCTQEACDFRDVLANRQMEAAVLGISPDDVATHEKFRAEHRLPFPLLADPDHEVAKAYGAYGNRGARGEGVRRSTFLVDPEGRVARAYYNVRADGHAAEVAADLDALKRERAAAGS